MRDEPKTSNPNIGFWFDLFIPSLNPASGHKYLTRGWSVGSSSPIVKLFFWRSVLAGVDHHYVWHVPVYSLLLFIIIIFCIHEA